MFKKISGLILVIIMLSDLTVLLKGDALNIVLVLIVTVIIAIVLAFAMLVALISLENRATLARQHKKRH